MLVSCFEQVILKMGRAQRPRWSVLYWECKRRLQDLQDFRNLLASYFDSLSKVTSGARTRKVETSESEQVRNAINLRLQDAVVCCELVGETVTVFYSPPPALGGFQGRLNLLREVFNLREYHITPDRIFDSLDRAIGEYERRKRQLYRRMFSPFFWLKLALVKIIEIPFQILGAAGFDAAKMENSLAGKTVKAIVGFVAFAAALLTILQILGWLGPVTRFVHTIASFRQHP
jgi:hypothetical protein